MSTFTVQSPEALRAIAHPVRQRILLQLAILGHARAADLARAIGEPPNSVSFHLRTLAKAGMIVEAPELARDKRDRVWRNAAESYQVEPDSPGAAGAILAPALAWLRGMFERAGAGEPADDGASRRALVLNNLMLTKDEATAFADELVALQERWTDRSLAAGRRDPATPREAYQVLIGLGPRDPS